MVVAFQIIVAGKYLIACAVGIWISSVSAASAGSVVVAWDPSEDATAVGYMISYGTQTRAYTQRFDARSQTQFELGGLADDATYYIAVQAYDRDGVLGTFSEELVVPAITTPPPAPTPGTPPAPSAFAIKCPLIPPVSESGRSGRAKVTYPAPVVTGGSPPVDISCAPASGSLFRLGTTVITCSAIDGSRRVASCTTTAVVMARP